MSFETIRLISQGSGEGQKDNESRAWKRIPGTTRLRNEILIMRFIRSLPEPRFNEPNFGASPRDILEFRIILNIAYDVCALGSYSPCFWHSFSFNNAYICSEINLNNYSPHEYDVIDLLFLHVDNSKVVLFCIKLTNSE